MKTTDLKRRSMFVSEEIWNRLGKLAKAKGFSTSDLVRRAIVELLERMEEK